MKESEAIDCHNNSSRDIFLQMIGYVFTLTAVAASSIVCFFTRTVSIEKPLILVLASVFILFNFKRLPSIGLLQKIIILYLICVLLNQLSLQFLQIPLGRTRVTVSISFPVLILLAAGFIVSKKSWIDTLIMNHNKYLLLSWAAAFALIAMHMLLLTLLLIKFYGYGYEDNLNVLGNLCFYFLIFLFSWNQLDNTYFRQIAAAFLSILFISLFITQR